MALADFPREVRGRLADDCQLIVDGAFDERTCIELGGVMPFDERSDLFCCVDNILEVETFMPHRWGAPGRGFRP